jgi:hypothetical protein
MVMFPRNSASILLNHIKNIQDLTDWAGHPIASSFDRPITACVFHSANCSADILVQRSNLYCLGISDFDYLVRT